MDARFERLQELLQRAQRGDKAAYGTFLSEVCPLIKQKIQLTLGDLLDSDDIAQECLIGIHRSLATYDPSKPLKPWILGVTRHKIADYFRVLARRGETELRETDFPVTNQESSTNPETEGPQRDALRSALQHLPQDQRRALELTKISGLSCREASLKEGIKEAAFRKRISRAYETLRKRVEKDLESNFGE